MRAEGRVTALDLSADLLEITAQRARARGCKNFTTRRADAHPLPFSENSFDLATSRLGVMSFRDPVLACKNCGAFCGRGRGRAFWPGGHSINLIGKVMMGVRHRHVGGWLLQPEGDPFKFAVPGGLSEILRSAGFNSIDEEAKTLPWTWPGWVEAVWEQAQSAAVPLRPMLERVPAEKWAEIHAEVHTAIRQYSDGEKIAFGVSVVLASGRK
jgi:hypothetical protein